MQAAKGDKQSAKPRNHNNKYSKTVTVAIISCQQPTTIIGFKAYSRGGNSCPLLETQLLPGTSEVMDLRKEATAATLLNQHNF